MQGKGALIKDIHPMALGFTQGTYDIGPTKDAKERKSKRRGTKKKPPVLNVSVTRNRQFPGPPSYAVFRLYCIHTTKTFPRMM